MSGGGGWAPKPAKSHYLKFDLTKNSIGTIPDLSDYARATGAIRVTILVRTQGAWERLDELPATHGEDPNWFTIKIPSIDGTELWIVPESKQSEVELKLGFDKPSRPLMTVPSKLLLSMNFRDPLFRNEIRFAWKPHVICTALTGTTLLSPTGDWTLEQLESLKDLGNFAFEA